MKPDHWHPLCVAMESNIFIEFMDVSAANEKSRTVEIDDEAAKLIGNMLTINKTLKKLELSNAGLTPSTAASILSCLKANYSVTEINLAGNLMLNIIFFREYFRRECFSGSWGNIGFQQFHQNTQNRTYKD
jgi:hypothetical protein